MSKEPAMEPEWVAPEKGRLLEREEHLVLRMTCLKIHER
jgi:hypothetical protein